MRARRSQYRPPGRPGVPGWRRSVALGLVALVLAGAGIAGLRVFTFLRTVTSFSNPVSALGKQVEPPAGSIPFKLNHGERVNLLLLGYGGQENDAPYLTDSMMVVSIDPAARRIMQVSIPRDLMVDIDALAGRPPLSQKINVAYAIGMDDVDYPGKKPAYRGSRLAGGRLAEDTVTKVTGLRFDAFIGVDFKAFRDVVNAIGGVDVTLETPLDDCHYPDYHEGYLNGGVPVTQRCPNRAAGIHFPAGRQHVNGEQALELARSRDAIEPEQASDYGRARRQQVILNAVRKRTASAGGVARAPQLMDALQKNFITTLDLSDMQAIYSFAARLPDSAIGHFGITEGDLVDRYYMRRGSCADYYADALCPVDPTYRSMQAFFAGMFVDPKVLGERAPVGLVNASQTLEDMGERVSAVLRPMGFSVADPLRRRTQEKSVIYDYSGGRYPRTVQWMQQYFGATVVPAGSATPAPPAGAENGVVVVLGRDYALRWIGRG